VGLCRGTCEWWLKGLLGCKPVFAKPKHGQVQKIWHAIGLMPKHCQFFPKFWQDNVFSLAGSKPRPTLVALPRYWLALIFIYPYFGLPLKLAWQKIGVQPSKLEMSKDKLSLFTTGSQLGHHRHTHCVLLSSYLVCPQLHISLAKRFIERFYFGYFEFCLRVHTRTRIIFRHCLVLEMTFALFTTPCTSEKA